MIWQWSSIFAVSLLLQLSGRRLVRSKKESILPRTMCSRYGDCPLIHVHSSHVNTGTTDTANATYMYNVWTMNDWFWVWPSLPHVHVYTALSYPGHPMLLFFQRFTYNIEKHMGWPGYELHVGYTFTPASVCTCTTSITYAPMPIHIITVM